MAFNMMDDINSNGVSGSLSQGLFASTQPKTPTMEQPPLEAIQQPTPLSLPQIQNKVAGIGNRINNLTSQGVKALDDSYNAQAKAVSGSIEVGKQKAVEDFSYQQELNNKVQEQQTQEAEREKVRQEALGEEVNRLQTFQEDLKASKVDPNRYYANASTGKKIANVFLATLGGFAQGMVQTGTGAPAKNYAMEAIDAAIDRDIQAQRDEIAKKGEVIQSQQSIVGLMRQQFGDERQASAASKVALYDKAEQDFKTIAAKYKSPELQARAAEFSADLQGRRAQALNEFKALSLDRLERNTMDEANIANLNADNEARQNSMRLARLAKDDERRELVIPGIGLGLDREAAKKGREIVSAGSALVDSIADLQKYVKENDIGAITMSPEKRKAVATRIGTIKDAYRASAAMGTLDKGSSEALDKTIGDPLSVFGNASNLTALKDMVTKNVNTKIKPFMDPQYFVGYRDNTVEGNKKEIK